MATTSSDWMETSSWQRTASRRELSHAVFWLNLTLPPYSSNLAPCDFSLFPSLKTKHQGIRFETSEAVLQNSEAILKDLTKNGLHHVFEEWQQRSKKCIQLGRGEYFEKDHVNIELEQ